MYISYTNKIRLNQIKSLSAAFLRYIVAHSIPKLLLVKENVAYFGHFERKFPWLLVCCILKAYWGPGYPIFSPS